jgi:hypothetical protein
MTDLLSLNNRNIVLNIFFMLLLVKAVAPLIIIIILNVDYIYLTVCPINESYKDLNQVSGQATIPYLSVPTNFS